MSPASLKGLSLGGGSQQECVQIGFIDQDLSISQKPAESWEYLREEGTLSCPYGHFWASV